MVGSLHHHQVPLEKTIHGDEITHTSKRNRDAMQTSASSENIVVEGLEQSSGKAARIVFETLPQEHYQKTNIAIQQQQQQHYEANESIVAASRLAVKQALESTKSIPAKEISIEYIRIITGNMTARKIGIGGQGSVFRGFDSKLNCSLAVKELPMGLAFEKEMFALSILDHPNVIRLLVYARCDEKKQAYLIYEYAPGGTMAEALRDISGREKFTWQRRVDALLQLVLALKYCHSHKIKHRDVKPENICFADEDFSELQLIDFGISTEHEGFLTSWGGTPVYMAPEYLDERKHFDEKTEVYSLGVVMIAVISSTIEAKSLRKLVAYSTRRAYSIVDYRDRLAGGWDHNLYFWYDGVIEQIAACAQKCLKVDPADRPYLQDIIDMLSDLKQIATNSIILSKLQATALEMQTQMCSWNGMSSSSSKKEVVRCPCGQAALVACQQGHVVCGPCLEGSLKRQKFCDFFHCQACGCDEVFSISELRGLVPNELLADHALAQQESLRFLRDKDKVESIVKKIYEKTSSLSISSMARDIVFGTSMETECPGLCILWPVQSSRSLFRRPFNKEYRLYFLCAYDRSPIESFIEIDKHRAWVKRILPVLSFSLWACRLMVGLGLSVSLPTFIPGNSIEEQITSIEKTLCDNDFYKDVLDGLKAFSKNHLNNDNNGGGASSSSIQGMICERANNVDPVAKAAVAKVATMDGNYNWCNEMELANKNNTWAWVKKRNKQKWMSG